ncbi:hypothetical protein M422DRAFT_219231 [Sphaerobolus stellatus SS14]|nr:hypothetical protein M422DRAFT_219231 [Sphaerobolus stellatus SS14]
MEPVLILVMGVSGAGKSTLAKAVAEDLHIPMLDADDLHPKANIDKMSRGEPLTDRDREPWLELVRKTAEDVCAEQQASEQSKKLAGVVVACSSLKKYYRDILRGTYKPKAVPSHLDPPQPHILPTYIVYINGRREELESRMKARKGHFMKSSMLDSQLRTLESPEGEDGVVTVRLEDPTEVQVREAREKIFEMIEQRKK